MAIALVTNYLPPYRLPLYELLAQRYGVEVHCFGGDADYVPRALRDLDRQLEDARFPAHKLRKQRDAAKLAAGNDLVIASTAGRVALPAAFRGARRADTPFILWASLWRHPRTLAHRASFPLMLRLYRNSNAILTYGPHVSRYVARYRRDDGKIFEAAQVVEPEIFGRAVDTDEIERFRTGLGLPDQNQPIVLFVGRLVSEKGIDVLLRAWERSGAGSAATLCVVGDGPLADRVSKVRGVRAVGRIDRENLPVAYAASDVLVVPSLRTRHFLEPWGLVCNEAMLQEVPVIASNAVGAAAGGLVREGETGRVVAAGNESALATALADLLENAALRERIGAEARREALQYTYERAADAFGAAIAAARS